VVLSHPLADIARQVSWTEVLARLAMVILIGLLVENLVFNTLERVTVKKWGMQR